MAWIFYGHKDLLPDTLNELYKNKDVYDQGNLINFWEAANCFDDITADEYYACLDEPCDLSKIDKYLAERKPVIAMVDFSPNPGVQTHFVLIIGKENDSYLINDPWTGETYFFEAKYGDPARYIFGLRLYSGEVVEDVSCEDQVKDLEDKIISLKDQTLEQAVIIGQLEGKLREQEADNKDLSKQLVEARAERSQAVGEAKTLTETVDGLESRVSSLKEDKTALKADLKACKAQGISSMSGMELIMAGIKKILGGGD